MNIQKAYERLKELATHEVNHLIQRIDAEIQNYKVCCVNYPAVRMKEYAEPYLEQLNDMRKAVLKEWDERKRKEQNHT